MQGSHLCNYNLCIIHSVYETAEVNYERKECHAYARYIRKEGLKVPEQCDKHFPACLLQYAGLTEFETYLIQFFVWRSANGMAPSQTPPKPRWHPYRTLKDKLPLTFVPTSSPALNLPDLDSQQRSQKKPEHKCPFFPRSIKGFKSLIALWSHFVHQHYDDGGSNIEKKLIDVEDLLREIRRTAALRRVYWEEHSEGGKQCNPTMLKLNEVFKDGFSWGTVLGWDLR
jgi:hypothetical protein